MTSNLASGWRILGVRGGGVRGGAILARGKEELLIPTRDRMSRLRITTLHLQSMLYYAHGKE